MTPRVTWMIPVRNGMPYLPETLASIERQTFGDWRVVAWDNGSTDGTVEELNRWIPSRLPGRVVADRPMPLGDARAQMVRECDTEFCALVDADDVCDAARLDRQVRFMDAHPEVAVVGSQISRLSPTGEDLGPYSDYPLAHDDIVVAMLVTNPIAQPAVLMRTAAVLAAGNYRDFSPTHVEDYDLWLRMAAARFRLANVPDRLVAYRVHDRSTTQMSLAANRLGTEMDRRRDEAAADLFGCDRSTIDRLRRKRHPLAAWPLWRIARHLNGGWTNWRSADFARFARLVTSDRDVVSRVLFAVATGGGRGLLAEVVGLCRFARRRVLARLRRPPPPRHAGDATDESQVVGKEGARCQPSE